jgi:hypothetical protein
MLDVEMDSILIFYLVNFSIYLTNYRYLCKKIKTFYAAYSDYSLLLVPVMTIFPASKINAVDLGSVILWIKAGNLPIKFVLI